MTPGAVHPRRVKEYRMPPGTDLAVFDGASTGLLGQDEIEAQSRRILT
jgi:hypothetical protein